MRNDQSQNVLILYNLPHETAARKAARICLESEFGVLEEVSAVASALTSLNMPFRIAGVRALEDLPGILSASPERVVFNLVEGFDRNPNSSFYVPAICESFGKVCTGNDTPSHLLAIDKWRTNAVLGAAGLPTPPGAMVMVGDRIDESLLPDGPFIVKPALSDASEGIDANSVIEAAGPALRRVVERIHRQFHQPALIEKMIGRREINVALMQHGHRVEVVGIAEIDFSAFAKDKPAIVDYAAKWIEDSFEFQNTPRILPAPLPHRLSKEIARMSLAAWRVVQCNDYARVDFRLDEHDRPFILEINPNPDIAPGGGFAAALHSASIPFSTFVRTMVRNARARLPADFHRWHTSPRRTTRRAKPPCLIRRMRYADRDPLLAMIKETGFFRADEVEIAREVLDTSVAEGDTGHYQTFVAKIGDEPAGWVSFGPTACTMGTYDIYWIVVSPRHQRSGIGRTLMDHAEQLIRQHSGHNIVIETSGRKIYDTTRQFYLKLGYKEAARLKDFYARQDDKVVYMKTLV